MTRGEVWQAAFGAAGGPGADAGVLCLIVSPSELSDQLEAVTVLPVIPSAGVASFRVPATIDGREHRILTDQVTTLSKQRLRQRVGALDRKTLTKVLTTLREMFSE